MIKTYLKPLASLKLTVVLLAMAMFLIFAGTLAQVHDGIWHVMSRYFRSFFVWIDLQLFVPREWMTIPGAIPFPGGFTVGGLMLLNLLAAHAVRFRLRWKRAGILLMHSGVILLIVGEMVTALAAREGNMSIDEGSYAIFTEDIRTAELAVIDASDPEEDHVVVVPQSMLAGAQGPIRDPRLPFEVSVVRWMGNSRVFSANMGPEGLQRRATAGIGQNAVAQEMPPVSGVEEQTINVPTAYVTLTAEGRNLGTWLVSAYIEAPQPVTVGGKTYGIVLRFKRTYKPYTVHLIDFKHDLFVGTNVPRNFSSLVRLVDPAQHEDREVLIWMNHPMRYGGETFYQSSFKPDNSGTVLQVVRNPGWLLPYVSCTLVALGMLIHFGLHLYRFMRRAL